MNENVPRLSTRGARQKMIVTILGLALIAGGAFVLFALKQMPLPMRILVGLTDVFAGLTMLVLVRQKFSAR